MQDEFVPVFVTDKNEVIGFVHQYLTLQLIFCWMAYFVPPLIYLLRYTVFKEINSMQSATKGSKLKIVKSFTAGVPIIVGFVWYSLNWQRLQHVYFLDFFYSYFHYSNEVKEFEKIVDARGGWGKLEVKNTIKGSLQKVFVVVIGESLTRNHMQLYGYSRNTTPSLRLEKDLLVFKNVVSGATRTNESLKLALTFADNNHPDDYFKRPSIVDLFKMANVKTYWISAQNLTDRAGNLFGVIAKNADVLFRLGPEVKKGNDGAVLEPFEKALEDTIESKVIFVHLSGNHIEYSDRYPSAFGYFHDSTGIRTSLSSPTINQLKYINDYDNSVMYNDYIVSSLLESLKKKDACSCLLYFSDHGDEVFDFRDVVGHHSIGIASRYMCEVPFMLWRSERYKKAVNLDIDFNRPYDTEDLIYSISQLSGLSYADYDSTKSFFSKSFKSKERLVAGITYDSLLRRFPGK
jgi:heptose-I-phosphate ethanolaminephosphotransferase